MKKITSIALAIVLSMSLMSGLALAHDGGDKGDNKGRDNSGSRISAFTRAFNDDREDHDRNENENERHRGFGFFSRAFLKEDNRIGAVARVTSLSNGNEITAEGLGKAERTFTIETDSNTDFFLGNGKDANFADIDVGETIIFKGAITDKDDNDVMVDASSVRILGDVDFAAKAKISGEVTDVDNNDNQLTITTDNNETITVNATDFTVIKDEDGNHTTFADISEGMNVRIKGFWNSLHNLVTALKIRITS